MIWNNYWDITNFLSKYTFNSAIDKKFVSEIYLIRKLRFSSFHRFSIGQVIGWAILAALFSFSETNWEFPWLCLGPLSCWNVHLHFILVYGIGILVFGYLGICSWFLIKNEPVICFIYPSLNYMKCAIMKNSPMPWCSHIHHQPFDFKIWCVL